MERQKKKQKGITLIALVISIIVMLILAGVSLNMTIGENGIISQAQNATYKQSCAVLEEYFNQEYVNLYSNSNSEPENKIEMFIKDVGLNKLIQRAKNYNYYFIDSATGNTYYYIEKSALPKEIKNSIQGGDTSLTNQTIWAEFNDIYGITSDLKVYYCSSSNDARVGATDETLTADLSQSISGMSKGSQWATALGLDKDISVSDLMTVKELTISDPSLDLTLLYNFGSLKNITFKNLVVDNISGVSSAGNLEYVFFDNCDINDYSSLASCSKLKYLYFYLRPEMTEEVANKQIKNLCDDKKGIANADLPTLTYFGIFGVDKTAYVSDMKNIKNENTKSNVSDISDLTKFKSGKYVKYLFLHNTNISSIESLSGFTNLYQTNLWNNKKLTNLDGLSNHTNLTNIYAQNCDLKNVSGLRGCTRLNSVYLVENSNLKSLSGLDDASSLKYLYATSCRIGEDEVGTTASETDALYSLRNNSSLLYAYLGSNNLKRVEYLKNAPLQRIYLNGNNNLNGDSLLAIKDSINNCGSFSSIPTSFSLFLLDDNTKNLSLSGQTVTDNNFRMIKNKTRMIKLNLDNIKITDSAGNVLSAEETDAIINEVLSTLTAMQYLNLNGVSNLSTIAFVNNMTNLKEIILYGTAVKSGILNGIELLNNRTNMKSLGVDNEGIQLSTIITTLNRLQYGYSYNENFFLGNMGLQVKNAKMFESLNNSTCGLTQLSLTNLNVTSVIDLTKCTTLKKVALIYGTGGKIKLPNSVEEMHLDIQNIDGNYPSSLKTAGFVNGALTNTALANMAQNCPNLTSITTGNSYAVTDLSCMRNAVFKNTLIEFSLNGNSNHITNKRNLKSVDALAGYTSLEYLCLYSTDIKDLSFLSTNTNLLTLVMDRNNVESVEPLKNLTLLKSITLTNNKIASLHGIEGLTELETLNIQNNCLQDIIQYSNDEGGVSTVQNLSIIAELNRHKLKNLYLDGNTTLSDFSLISGLSWDDKNGF